MKQLAAMAVLQVLCFLLTPTVAFSYLIPLPPPLVAAASGSDVAAPPPVVAAPRPGCPSMCGNVNIPYPFGISVDCAWPGIAINFTITCNHSYNPPRPYWGSNIEVISISLEAGEMRVFSPVSYICYNSSNTTAPNGVTSWSLYTEPLLISPTRNVFTAIGCYTVAYLEGRQDSSFSTGCITTCRSLHEAAQDGEECTGLGCCQTSLPTNLTTIHVYWGDTNESYTPPNEAWRYSPCNSAFIADKDWYHFKRRDLTRLANETFIDRVGDRTIPMVLDWAIRDGQSCRAPSKDEGVSVNKPTAPACTSRNSFCFNATQGAGYLCNCSQGYMGNPYVTDGCTNINECMLRKSNPVIYEKLYHCGSNSKCRDTQGGYECKCKFGHKGDGKSENGCQPIFPGYAIAIVAITIAVILAIILYTRRKRNQRFNKNGGKILKAHGITIYTERYLQNITDGFSKLIGKGQFGNVYEGTIDGTQAQRVAVKRSKKERVGMVRRWQKMIRHEVPQKEQEDDASFVNEITFQFKTRHPNVVQLLGCCLETEIPILVFEFVPNGSLEDVLHGAKKTCTLSLLKRLDIAIGSAEAISHMHSQGDCTHVHGDVKPANILLDKDLNPKVSDFGSSRLLSIDSYSRAVAADRKYMDPVYCRTDRFTVKSDVYSFGVVLLELITRKTAMYDGNKSLQLDFVKCCKDEGNGRKMYDRDILTDDNGQSHVYVECLDKIGALAVRCLKEDVDERPTMAEVVEELKNVKLIAFGNSDSEEAS